MKKLLGLMIVVLFLLLGSGVWWLYSVSSTPELSSGTKEVVAGNVTNQCLQDGQFVDYKFEDNRMMAESYIEVFVKNEETQSTELSFKSDLRTSYQPFEIRQCGIYFNKLSGFDYKKVKPLPGMHESFWKYDYAGNGRMLIDLTANDYSTDFRVSPDEKYIALLRGYGGKENYALVIKDLVTLEDTLVIPRSQIKADGFLHMKDWTDNSRYLWMFLHGGAYVYGWIRVDTSDWTYATFEAPEGVLGGYPLDIDTGWIPVSPGSYWTGSDDDDIIREERLQLGITTGSLYLYNVITEEEILIHTEPDPVWTGWPIKWLDEKTLEYTLPDKTKAIHKLL